MNSVAIVQQYGFNYWKDCGPCGKKYGIYINPNYSGVEIKIKKQGGLTKIYKSGYQVAQVLPNQLEQTLKNVGLA